MIIQALCQSNFPLLHVKASFDVKLVSRLYAKILLYNLIKKNKNNENKCLATGLHCWSYKMRNILTIMMTQMCENRKKLLNDEPCIHAILKFVSKLLNKQSKMYLDNIRYFGVVFLVLNNRAICCELDPKFPHKYIKTDLKNINLQI
jgi:hypothetical protein